MAMELHSPQNKEDLFVIVGTQALNRTAVQLTGNIDHQAECETESKNKLIPAEAYSSSGVLNAGAPAPMNCEQSSDSIDTENEITITTMERVKPVIASDTVDNATVKPQAVDGAIATTICRDLFSQQSPDMQAAFSQQQTFSLPSFSTVVSKPSRLAEAFLVANTSGLVAVSASAAITAASTSALPSHSILNETRFSGYAIQFLAQRAAQQALAESLQSKQKMAVAAGESGARSVPAILSRKRHRLALSLGEEPSSELPAAGQRKQRSFTHTGAKTCVCEICNAVLSAPASLKTHMLIHSGDKPYHCVMCEAEFRHQSTLKRHMCIHTGEKKFACEICHSAFARKTELTQHQRSHSTARPFACKLCGSSYKHPKDLSQHLRAHVRNMAYKCSECDASFDNPTSLKEHTDSHEKSPFSCEICGSECASISALTQHVKTCHMSEISPDILCCEICSAKCGTFAVLAHHMRISHMADVSQKTPSRCHVSGDSCNKYSEAGVKNENDQTVSLHDKDSLESILVTSAQELNPPQYPCKMCGAQFQAYAELTHHTKKTHWFSTVDGGNFEGVHACPQCGMEYPRLKSLTQHMKKSHGINLLPCAKCGCTFVEMQDWLQHTKVCS